MSFYDATVPAFLQILGSLSGSSPRPRRTARRRISSPTCCSARGFIRTCCRFSKQIQLACDFAAKGCARLTHSEVPSTPDTEKTFEELRQRLAKTVDYVKAFKPAQFEGADASDVTFPIGPNNTLTLKGQQFLSRFAFPNFYFHAATAHGILRHNGVEIGKRDFLGVS